MDPLDPSLSVAQKTLFLCRSYLKDHLRTLFWAILAGAVAAGSAGFGIPVIVRKVFPIVFNNEPLPPSIAGWVESHFTPGQVDWISLWGTAAFLPLIMLIRGLATFTNVYLLNKIGLKVLEKMRLQVFSRLQELPLSFHEQNKRGDTLSRLVQETQYLQEGLMNVLNDLVIQPLTLIAAIGYLAYESFHSDHVSSFLLNMLIAMACVPLVKKIGSKMLKRASKMLSGMGEITATIQESLAAQREVMAFNLQDLQAETLRQHIRNFFSVMMKMTFWRQLVTPAVEIVSAFAMAFSLFIAARKGLEEAQFAAIATALIFCYEPIKKLGVVHNTLRMTTLLMNRINKVIYAEDEMPEPSHPVPIPHPRGKITYDHVGFSYDGDHQVLKDLNLEVPPGQIVALVGPSGSGKTTFINLLCRFYDAQEGRVAIDDIDVRSLAKSDLRRSIGLVSQHPIIFRGSILENIRLGRQTATDEDVCRAAELAYVDEFASQEANGYNRLVGESGEGLSGGQRQRVSIARAFLKDAPILILDEATASLDMNSEAKIQASLEVLTKGKTTFIIAHRFSTIRMAHRILVFDQGRIVGDGSHTELYASSALYRDLYEMQINVREDSPDE